MLLLMMPSSLQTCSYYHVYVLRYKQFMHKFSNDINILINSANIKQILMVESVARHKNANNSKRTHGNHNEISCTLNYDYKQ